MNESKMLESLLSQPPSEKPEDKPIITTYQDLPLIKLSWENFERFCYQLGSSYMECLETAYIYGKNGQKQDGIDLYFSVDGEKNLWQIKRYKKFTCKNIDKSVEEFMNGKWKNKATIFTLCIANTDDTKLIDTISENEDFLRKEGVTFVVMNSMKLTIKAMKNPELIVTFFGEQWLKPFGLELVSKKPYLEEIYNELRENKILIASIKDYFITNELERVIFYPDDKEERWFFLDNTPDRNVNCNNGKGIWAMKFLTRKKDNILLIKNKSNKKAINDIYDLFNIYHLSQGVDRTFVFKIYDQLLLLLDSLKGEIDD